MKVRKNGIRYLLYFLFFAVFLYIGLKVPYCHDEWRWGLWERVELMKTGFDGYNGRYLGNMFALVITRSQAAKTLVIGGCMIVIAWLMETNIRRKHVWQKDTLDPMPLLGTALLLLAVPSTLFAQSYGWPAAFVNFEIPVALFLLYFVWTDELYLEKVEKYSLFQTLIVIPLGISTQLFSENITVVVVAYAVWMIAYTGIRYKKVYPMQINYLWSVILGAVIMFSNSAYSKAATTDEGYKRISLGIRGIFEQFVTQIWPDLMLNNRVLNIVLAAALVLLIIRSGKRTLLTIEMVLVFCGYSIFGIFHGICSEWVFDSNETINGTIIAGLSVLFLLNVLLCIWLLVDKKERLSLCITYLGAFAFAAPLVAANPIGPRCFYISYVFQALAVLKLIQYLMKGRKVNLFYPAIALATVVVILSVVYLRIFRTIGQVNDYRAELIEQCVENDQKELTLPILPYKEYCWKTMPTMDAWERKFKAFYHIPEDVTLKFEELE